MSRKPIADGFLPITQSVLYEAPPERVANIDYLSLFNAGTAEETALIYLQRKTETGYNPPRTIGRWELTEFQRAQAFDSDAPPALGPGDRLVGETTNPNAVEWILVGDVVTDIS